MPLIDEHLFVLKHSKLPKGSTYVLKTESVKERFLPLNIPDLRFELIFDTKQHLWKDGRDELLIKGLMRICELTFNPQCKYSFCDEWNELHEFPKVDAELYALPTNEWRTGGFSKEEIHSLIDDQIKFLSKTSQKQSIWRIDVDLLFRENSIISRATCRTHDKETHNEIRIAPRSRS